MVKDFSYTWQNSKRMPLDLKIIFMMGMVQVLTCGMLSSNKVSIKAIKNNILGTHASLEINAPMNEQSGSSRAASWFDSNFH